MLKKLASLATGAVLALSLASPAAAGCYGSGGYETCYDSQSGNRYSTQRYGNTTTTRGSNSRTGSRWSQDSSTYGGTTFHRGRDASGNSWRSKTYGNSGGYGGQSNNITERGISNCGISGCD